MHKDGLLNRHRMQVRVAILDANRDIRAIVRGSMRDIGFSTIFETDRPRDIITSILANDIDLLICDLTLHNEVMCAAVRDIRFRKLGSNPFPITVGLTGNRDQAHIRRAILSGYDLVLLKPIEQALLKKRILTFLADRKPFVVLSNYVGPDRRDIPRLDEDAAPLMPVPNPIKLISEGKSRSELLNEVRSASSALDGQKVERAIDAICLNANRLNQTFDEESEPEVRRELLLELSEQIDDTVVRIGMTHFKSLQSSCLHLRDITTHLMQDIENPTISESKRLLATAEEIRKSFLELAKNRNGPVDPFGDDCVSA